MNTSCTIYLLEYVAIFFLQDWSLDPTFEKKIVSFYPAPDSDATRKSDTYSTTLEYFLELLLKLTMTHVDLIIYLFLFKIVS